MGHTQRVKIVEVSKVSPPPINTDDAPKCLLLTFFDLVWLRSSPIQRLYFFELPNANDNESTVVPRLKHSLSLALRHFLPLAGHLVWPEPSGGPFVRYLEGDGVSFAVAEPGPGLDHFRVLSGTDNEAFFEAAAYHSLVPDLPVSREKAAVVAFQVTLFPGSGFSVGMTLHHAVLDGKSVHMFVKSWAHFCRSPGSDQLPEELRPGFDRTALKDPAGLREIFSSNWMSFDGPDNRSLKLPEPRLPPDGFVRGTFKLTRRSIEKIRRAVGVDAASTFSLVCAYVWVCLLKAEGIADNDDCRAVIGVLCDCRARLEPPLPANYFGNCLSGGIIMAGAKELAAGNWREGLGSAVKSLVEGVKVFESVDGVFSGAENWVLGRASMGPVLEGKFCAVAGSPRFEAYVADFGWGRPRKTDVVSIDTTRAILLQDARDGDGVELGLALKKPDMEAFASLFLQGLQC